MNFIDELSDQVNRLPDHIRRDPVVVGYVECISQSYSSFIRWTGSHSFNIDVNWNHLIRLIAGIRHIHPDNIDNYIYQHPVFHPNNDDNGQHPDSTRDLEYGNLEDNLSQSSHHDTIDDTPQPVRRIDFGHDSCDSDDSCDSCDSDDSCHSCDSDDSDDSCDSNDEVFVNHPHHDNDCLHSTPMRGRLWACSYCEDFTGSYNVVAQHELHCPLNSR